MDSYTNDPKASLYQFDGQKSERECMGDEEGRKRRDFYVPFLFQFGCLVATVSSNGLAFAAQERDLFDVGLTESATGAGFPAGYVFVESDTNVEKDGTVAPTGQVFVVQSGGIVLGRPFIDNAGNKRYPEWLDEYKGAAMEAILTDASVRLFPRGENGGNFSLGALCLNPSMRGIAAGESLPQVVHASGGLPVPLDGRFSLTNEDGLVKLVVARGFDVPQRATPAGATAYFPVGVCFEGRAMPRPARPRPTSAA
jgi:hypothetical protein